MNYYAGLKAKYPELFMPDREADPRKRTRTRPMEVMNLGFPRTGTMSMQRALNALGYPCYHSYMLFSNIRDCAMWDAAMDAKFSGKGALFTRTEWDQLLGAYGAISADPPAIAFAEELIAMYPDAKVILVNRETESWYASFCSGVIESAWSPAMHFMSDLDPNWLGRIRDTHMRWIRLWMGANSKEEHCQVSKDAYRKHYELVRRVTPKDRLLEFTLEEGWEPLCKFLGKPIPRIPFPHVHDQAALSEVVRITFLMGFLNFLKKYSVFLGTIGVVFLVWWYL